MSDVKYFSQYFITDFEIRKIFIKCKQNEIR